MITSVKNVNICEIEMFIETEIRILSLSLSLLTCNPTCVFGFHTRGSGFLNCFTQETLSPNKVSTNVVQINQSDDFL